MNNTQIKILEAAEKEFAEFGFVGSSIRNITQGAGVNIASVNYHFGSKEELFKKLFEYRLSPLNDLRLELLEEKQVEYGEAAVPIPELIEIFIRPTLQQMLTIEGAQFVRTVARCMSEPLDFMEDLDKEIFHEIFARFHHAFGKALPELSDEAVFNNLNFAVSSLVGMMMHYPRVLMHQGRVISDSEFERLLQQFIHYISSGILGAKSS